jgi:hypothetical protein
MLRSTKASSTQDPALLRMAESADPGWVPGTLRLPRVGEEVRCIAGMARVERLLGRTGDGSRLLELRLLASEKQPFFAAASNILCPKDEPAGA